MFTSLSPRRLFLIDALGALLSAFMLGVILPLLDEYFGIPAKVLFVLAGIALLLFSFSFSTYLRQPEDWKPYLVRIAFANTAYCVLTLGCLLYFWSRVTGFDWIYFIGEIAIVLTLAYWEYRAGRTK